MTRAGTTVTSGRWLLAGLAAWPGQPSGTGPWELTVSGGRIASLVPARAGSAGDGRSLICLPLLVNAHDHGRGLGNVMAGVPDGPLEPWIGALDSPVLRWSQPELAGDAAAAMLRSGVGAAVFCVNPVTQDIDAEMRMAHAAIERTGMRAALVYPFADASGHRYGRARDAPGWPAAMAAARLAAVERLAGELAGPRVDVQLGPVGPQWVSEPTLRLVAEHSERTGRRVHMHLLESPAQRGWADETYPEGLLARLDKLGLLTDRTWFAHGTQLRDDELALLAERGCGLTLNPSSNLRLASGVSPVARAAGTMPGAGLGLDGLALNDDHDAWTELRLARGIWQAQEHRAVSGAQILRLATASARPALGAAAPGRLLAAGQPADFVLADVTPWRHLLGQPGWAADDIVAAAVTPHQVSEVWVAGAATWVNTAAPSQP
jgi:cytosine/adenosine deaminase-related metal-dependent hydrolase